MQPSENSQLNLDYAQEWITFLKRRNFVLTIVWPILLSLVVLTSLSAFYFYQLEQTSQLSRDIELDKNQTLEMRNQELNSEIIALTSSNTTLNSELETLKSARAELSELNNDSASKLNITSQIVDNLNQQVAELKNEREGLSIKLQDSINIISQLREKQQQLIKQTSKEKSDSISELNKQINSRKSAYQALANRQQEMREDMDRLSNLASTKEKQIEKLQKDNQNLNSRLSEKNNETKMYKNKISILEKSYSDIENRLNALVSPIGNTVKKSDAINNTPAPQQTEASIKITGLEEIKKPAVQNKASKEPETQSFDHNQISILP